jgi:hypothetical protein
MDRKKKRRRKLINKCLVKARFFARKPSQLNCELNLFHLKIIAIDNDLYIKRGGLFMKKQVE